MKTLKIIQLVVWLVIIAFLLTVMLMFTFGKINFPRFINNDKQVVLLQQSEKVSGITGITMDLSSTDLVIKPSSSDEISITYRGPESLKDKLDVEVSVNNGELTIRQNKTQQFFFLWNLTSKIIEISLPQSYTNSINFKNSSGNVNISGDYQLSSFRSQLTSGDVNLENITCPDFSVACTSGNVTLGTIDARNIAITMTSGNLKAASITGDGNIEILSGDIRIDSLTGNDQLFMTSGNVNISSFSGSGSVSCSSGNIDITVAKSSGDFSARTNSGNVDVSLEAGVSYVIEANCTSGNVTANFPMNFSDNKNHASGQFGNTQENQLDLRTTSGNIRLSA